MSQTIHITQVDAAPIAKVAFPDYRGPQHQVRVSGTYSIGSTELCWSLSPWDGNVWAGRMAGASGRRRPAMNCESGAPSAGSAWASCTTSRRSTTMQSCGITDDEAVVLDGLCGLKSSYRQEAYREAGLDAARITAAVDSLVSRGLARRNKAGAVSVTVAGENARRAGALDRARMARR